MRNHHLGRRTHTVEQQLPAPTKCFQIKTCFVYWLLPATQRGPSPFHPSSTSYMTIGSLMATVRRSHRAVQMKYKQLRPFAIWAIATLGSWVAKGHASQDDLLWPGQPVVIQPVKMFKMTTLWMASQMLPIKISDAPFPNCRKVTSVNTNEVPMCSHMWSGCHGVAFPSKHGRRRRILRAKSCALVDPGHELGARGTPLRTLIVIIPVHQEPAGAGSDCKIC